VTVGATRHRPLGGSFLHRSLHHIGEHALAFHHSPRLHHQGRVTRATGSARNPWLVLPVLVAGFFMILIDTTIVNVAIPTIMRALSASLDQVLWVINAYTLVLAVFLIPAGRLGEIYGQRTLFIIGVLLFTGASIACGLSQSSGQLLAARAVQGLGAAALTPQTLALLSEVFPHEKAGLAVGIWGACAGLAAAAGPLLGGLIVHALSWRWIFLVNVPLGFAVVIAALLLVPNLRPSRDHAVDVVGVTALSGALVALVFGLDEGNRYQWGRFLGPVTVWEVSVAGVLLLGAFVLWERRHRQPLIPTVLFLDRTFSLMNAIGAAVAFALVGFFFMYPLYLQGVLHATPLTTGLVLTPLPLAAMVTAPIAGHLVERVPGRLLVGIGSLVFALGILLAALFAGPSSSVSGLIPALLLAGLGMGMTFAPLTAMAMAHIEPQMSGVASGVLNTTRQVGSVLGAAVVGAILELRLGAGLQGEGVNSSFVDAMRPALVTLVVVLMLAAAGSLVLRPQPAASQ